MPELSREDRIIEILTHLQTSQMAALHELRQQEASLATLNYLVQAMEFTSAALGDASKPLLERLLNLEGGGTSD